MTFSSEYIRSTSLFMQKTTQKKRILTTQSKNSFIFIFLFLLFIFSATTTSYKDCMNKCIPINQRDLFGQCWNTALCSHFLKFKDNGISCLLQYLHMQIAKKTCIWSLINSSIKKMVSKGHILRCVYEYIDSTF